MAGDMNSYMDFGVEASVAEVDKLGGFLPTSTRASMLFKEEESSLGVEVSRGLFDDYQEFVSLCQRSIGDAEGLKPSEFSGEKGAVNDLVGFSTECVRVRTESHWSGEADQNHEAFDSGEGNCDKSTNDVKFVDLGDTEDFEAPRTNTIPLDNFVEARSGTAYDETKELVEKEIGPGSFLEAKKMQLLKELEMMLVHGDKPQKENVTGLNQIGELTEADYTSSRRSSLRIEVVDETALIDSTPVSQNGNRRGMALISPAEPKERKRIENKNKKRPQRKEKESKKIGEAMNVQGNRKLHSRKEMEALRFTNAAEQRKLWKKIYNGFIPSVAKEYDDLASFKIQNPTGLILDPPQAWIKNVEAPAILSGVAARGRWSRMNIFVH